MPKSSSNQDGAIETPLRISKYQTNHVDSSNMQTLVIDEALKEQNGKGKEPIESRRASFLHLQENSDGNAADAATKSLEDSKQEFNG